MALTMRSQKKSHFGGWGEVYFEVPEMFLGKFYLVDMIHTMYWEKTLLELSYTPRI